MNEFNYQKNTLNDPPSNIFILFPDKSNLSSSGKLFKAIVGTDISWLLGNPRACKGDERPKNN